MFAIPRRYSHFVFGVIQSGLTIPDRGGNREPFCHRGRTFFVELGGFVAGVVDRNGADRPAGRPGHQVVVDCLDPRRTRLMRRDEDVRGDVTTDVRLPLTGAPPG